MRQKRRLVTLSTRHTTISELCACVPLSMLCGIAPDSKQGETSDGDHLVLTSRSLHRQLRTALDGLFPRSQPLSVLLLHIVQVESLHLSNATYKRRRYHASPDLLEQVIARVRRAIRMTDQLLVHEGVGVAIILPDVDQQGAHTILERVYHSISLLQAETIVPPLTRETMMTLGIGTYCEGSTSAEMLLYRAGLAARRLTLRPAISAELLAIKPVPSQEIIRYVSDDCEGTDLTPVPFMSLPRALPKRLAQLIPYSLAVRLSCVPVGRDHHRLTVAMLRPLDRDALHLLEEVTGLTIFPVSCQEDELVALLEQKW